MAKSCVPRSVRAPFSLSLTPKSSHQSSSVWADTPWPLFSSTIHSSPPGPGLGSSPYSTLALDTSSSLPLHRAGIVLNPHLTRLLPLLPALLLITQPARHRVPAIVWNPPPLLLQDTPLGQYNPGGEPGPCHPRVTTVVSPTPMDRIH